MKKLKLTRINQSDQGTLGILSTFGGVHVCLTLELPWRDNAPNVSCIPAREYIVDYIERSANGKYRDCYHLVNVPGRTGILFHKGNWAGDNSMGFITNSKGCILPGMTVEHWKNQKAVSKSGVALHKLREVTDRQSFKLEVVECLNH